MQLKVVIVSPKYQNNLGYIARVASNFGVKKLHIVQPRTKLGGKAAIMYAKHAHGLITSAAVYKTFEDSIRDCSVVIGTTGVWRKAGHGFRKVYLPEEMLSKLKKVSAKNTKVALVIGRDDIGLTKDELDRCNMVVYIATNPNYPVLNISHALAIMLFLMTQKDISKGYSMDFTQAADKKEMETLYKSFDLIVSNKKIREKEAVKKIFRRLISISQPTKREVHALITALK
ncbi:MAG: TrmJ/YjtD family RNA methyltransferase [Candidatus Micrarchaeota archaeon]|nr:TrmJ/YjtD family RNA methyltransferase [Candidatus Micrarchaeota archaeon]